MSFPSSEREFDSRHPLQRKAPGQRPGACLLSRPIWRKRRRRAGSVPDLRYQAQDGMRQVVAQVDQRDHHPVHEHQAAPGTRSSGLASRTTSDRVLLSLGHGLPRLGQLEQQVSQMGSREARQHLVGETGTVHLERHTVRSCRPQRLWSHPSANTHQLVRPQLKAVGHRPAKTKAHVASLLPTTLSPLAIYQVQAQSSPRASATMRTSCAQAAADNAVTRSPMVAPAVLAEAAW